MPLQLCDMNITKINRVFDITKFQLFQYLATPIGNVLTQKTFSLYLH